MENLNNSAVTLEQHIKYMKDPTDVEGKPYSTKQVSANIAHAQRETLYHKTLSPPMGRRVFDKEDVEQAKKDGWVDVPYIHPKNPKKVVEAKEPETPELEALKAEAKSMGIKVDKRWGIKKIKEAMLKA